MFSTLGHSQYLADMMNRSFIPAGNQVTSNEFEVMNAVQFSECGQRRYRNSNLRPQRMKPCNCLKPQFWKVGQRIVESSLLN